MKGKSVCSVGDTTIDEEESDEGDEVKSKLADIDSTGAASINSSDDENKSVSNWSKEGRKVEEEGRNKKTKKRRSIEESASEEENGSVEKEQMEEDEDRKSDEEASQEFMDAQSELNDNNNVTVENMDMVKIKQAERERIEEGVELKSGKCSRGGG